MQRAPKGKWCFQAPPRPEYQPDKTELTKRLTPTQYRVTQEKATERPFSGKYLKLKDNGHYSCVICGEELFSSDAKYDSGCGWPAFYDVVDGKKVRMAPDLSHVGSNLLLLAIKPDLVRTEVTCTKCGSHLGHLFDDGPKPTGKRYCINSCALNFEETGSSTSTSSEGSNVTTTSAPSTRTTTSAAPKSNCTMKQHESAISTTRTSTLTKGSSTSAPAPVAPLDDSGKPLLVVLGGNNKAGSKSAESGAARKVEEEEKLRKAVPPPTTATAAAVKSKPNPEFKPRIKVPPVSSGAGDSLSGSIAFLRSHLRPVRSTSSPPRPPIREMMETHL